jgi:hypothetical protein
VTLYFSFERTEARTLPSAKLKQIIAPSFSKEVVLSLFKFEGAGSYSISYGIG